MSARDRGQPFCGFLERRPSNQAGAICLRSACVKAGLRACKLTRQVAKSGLRPHDTAVRRPPEKRSAHELGDDPLASLEIQAQQPSGLSRGEPQTRHLEKFRLDTLQQGVEFHDVYPLHSELD